MLSSFGPEAAPPLPVPAVSSSSRDVVVTARIEAKRIKHRQTTGAAVSMLLAPSSGLREDIVRAGGKPKDHAKDNLHRIRQLEASHKLKKQVRKAHGQTDGLAALVMRKSLVQNPLFLLIVCLCVCLSVGRGPATTTPLQDEAV